MTESAQSVRSLIRRVEGDVRALLSNLWEEGRSLPSLTVLGKIEATVEQLWRSVCAAPFTFVATLCTSALAFSLVALFLLAASNFSSSLIASQQSLQIRFFLREGTARPERDLVRKTLASDLSVAAVREISAADALVEFEAMLGKETGLLDGLERENPLPESLEVLLREGVETTSTVERLQQLPEIAAHVQHVFFPQQSAERLAELLQLFRQGVVFATLGLLAMIGLIVGSASKLALYAHRDEVEILKLMGASPRRIVTPYVLEGIVQGLIGAVAGLFVAYGVYSLGRDFVDRTPVLSMVMPEFSYLSGGGILLLITSAACVSAIASFLAVRGLIRDRW